MKYWAWSTQRKCYLVFNFEDFLYNWPKSEHERLIFFLPHLGQFESFLFEHLEPIGLYLFGRTWNSFPSTFGHSFRGFHFDAFAPMMGIPSLHRDQFELASWTDEIVVLCNPCLRFLEVPLPWLSIQNCTPLDTFSIFQLFLHEGCTPINQVGILVLSSVCVRTWTPVPPYFTAGFVNLFQVWDDFASLCGPGFHSGKLM